MGKSPEGRTALADSWDFESGAGLDGHDRLDSQGLTLWASTWAALQLAAAVSSAARFSEHVSAARGGDALEVVAEWYLPRSATASRREVVARLLNVAAEADGLCEQIRRLERACQWASGRSVDQTDAAVPLPGDRRYVLRPDWREAVTTGARLIALRADGRCLRCEDLLTEDEFRRTRIGPGPDRRVRADYCDGCEEAIEDWDRTRHRETVRTVLDAAAGALATEPPTTNDQPLRLGPAEPWPLAKREAWLEERRRAR